MSKYNTVNEETRAQRRKLKGKGPKAYLQYFWDYYKLPTLIIIVVLIFIISVIRAVLNSRDTALGIVMINAGAYEDSKNQELHDQLVTYTGIDTSKYDVYLDMSSTLTPGTFSSQYDMATLQKLAAQQVAGELDVIMADAYNFEYYCKVGTILPLREVLDAQTLKNYEERGLVYYIDEKVVDEWNELTKNPDYQLPQVTQEDVDAREARDGFVSPNPDDMEKPVAVGLIALESKAVKQADLYPLTVPVMGYCVTGKNKELALKFTDFMFDQ